MTTNLKPDPDFMVAMFDDLGIPRLAELIEAGDLSSIDDESVRNYCRIAAMWDGPPLVDELRAHRLDREADEYTDDAPMRAVAEYFGWLLFEILSGEGPHYLERDREAYLRFEDDREILVTEEVLAHYQRVLAIANDSATARAFLALAPGWARESAQANTERVWDSSFEAVASRF